MSDSFRDDARQRWSLTIDDEARERIADRAFFNVPTVVTFSAHGGADRLAELYYSLVADPSKVRETIYAICLPECQRRGITYEGFIGRLSDCYEVAERMLLGAIMSSSGVAFDLDGFYGATN